MARILENRSPIDSVARKAVGFGFPLNGPAVFVPTYTTREQTKANLINYLLTNLKVQFEGVENVPNFPEAVPIVIGGGTSLVKGFMDVFNEQFDQNEFPIPVSEIVLIEDAHTAVARGCLSEAQLIEEDDEE